MASAWRCRVGALAAAGLGFVRKDVRLWPVMLVSPLVAPWRFWRRFRSHGNVGPLFVGVAGAVSLASGVIVVHGFPAMQMIYGGAIVLIVATLWNVWARRA